MSLHKIPVVRLALGAALPLALVVGTSCAARAVRSADNAAPAKSAVLVSDPELRTGTLPNGLRYYVRPNRMPAGRAFLALAVNAGSVLEDEDQRGFAHFLEHMAFNGTKNFPQQSLIDFIEASGMRFGADMNAYTSFDETVYTLTVPTDEPSFLARGLQILEDWAGGGILLDSAEVVAERGVVLSEWRMRALLDTASQRLQDHTFDMIFGGTAYRDRLPIGLPSLLQSATPEPLARFYRDWYRPDLMAVIVVGDFDADVIEREIRERFGRIPAAQTPRPRPEVVVPSSAKPVVDILRDKVSPRIDVLWPAPAAPRDPVAAFRQDLISLLLAEHLQQRLDRIRERESRPFIHAALGRQNAARELRFVGLQIVSWPDSLERGLAAALGELERIAQHGIPREELEQRKAVLLKRLERRAAGAAAQPSAAYVRDYTQHYLSGTGTILGPAEEYALAREVLPGITPEVLARAARFWRERRGLKVLVRVPHLALGFRPPTRESVLALLDSVRNAKYPPAAAQGKAAETPRLTEFPAPGRIVREVRHERAGILEWELSNGARVLFKQSDNHPDELLIRAWSPGGFSRLPDSLFFSSGRMVGAIMTEASGLGERGREGALSEIAGTVSRPLRVEIGFADESIELGGSARDAETLFQMLHLQFTAPRLDSADVATWANLAKFQPRPSTVHDALNQIFARGNPRLLPLQTAGLAELTRVEEALAVYRDRFGNAGDFTFLLVGAADPDEVKMLVERYIANLPATGERETPKDPNVRPFVGNTSRQRKVAQVARAQTLLVFDGQFPTEPERYFQEKERLAALTLILEQRLRNRLREELSGTYSVAVDGHTYRLYDEHFRVLFAFQSAPERMRELSREMLAILDSVRTHGATETELRKAARILQRQLEVRLQDNDFWLNQLQLYNRLGLPLDRIVAPYSAEPLTPDEIKNAAVEYLPKNSSIQITDLPEDGVVSPIKQ